MPNLFPAVGLAVAVAGGDKLAGNRAYQGMFRHLGWSRDGMNAVAAAELAGGLLMGARPTRRLGGALVAASSIVMLSSEIEHRDSKLAAPRALILLIGLAAFLAPTRKIRFRAA